MPAYTFTVILEPIAAGGYAAHCPSFPGLPIPEDRGAILSLQSVTLPDDL